MKPLRRRPRAWLLVLGALLVLLIVPPALSLALVSYAGKGQARAVGLLLALRVPPSDDAIGEAAYSGRTDVVRLLLDAGGSPNAENETGETALTWAAGHGHIGVVRLLLSRGADPNYGCREITPLKYARDGGFPQIVALLKQAGEKE